jgi:hypothetical protein
MTRITAFLLLLVALVFLLALHFHDEAHRYDVVLAAAGSGGSQNDTGSTEVRGYLVDHRTGRVWLLVDDQQLPVTVRPCGQKAKMTKNGCEFVPPNPSQP